MKIYSYIIGATDPWEDDNVRQIQSSIYELIQDEFNYVIVRRNISNYRVRVII